MLKHICCISSEIALFLHSDAFMFDSLVNLLNKRTSNCHQHKRKFFKWQSVDFHYLKFKDVSGVLHNCDKLKVSAVLYINILYYKYKYISYGFVSQLL